MAPHLPGTILVIDDEPSVIRALTGLLRRDGYHVGTASNGRHAMVDPRAHLRRNLRFRPPENPWRLYEPDFDFLDAFFGRFSTPNSLLSEP
jgi:CheY-like chemotaxis protein